MKKHLKTVQLICILLLVCTLFLTACNGTQQPPASSEPESSENASTNDNNNINNNNNNSNNDNQISYEKKEKYDQASVLISQGKNEEAYALLKSISTYAPAQEKLKNFFWAPTTVAEKWKYSDDVDFRINIESYEYDSKGNLLGEKFSYDSNGNVLTGYDLMYGMYYTYDYKNGKLYQQKTGNYVTTYFYNSRGLISRTVTEYNDINYSSEVVYEYTYYPNGSVKTLVLDDYYEYHYDENGLITKLLCYSDYQTKELECSIIVSYGEYGITKIDVQDIERDESAIYTYSYDSVGKLEKLEVTSHYEDELYSTHLISYEYYQLCYSENLSVRERLSIICYTNLDAALEIIW